MDSSYLWRISGSEEQIFKSFPWVIPAESRPFRHKGSLLSSYSREERKIIYSWLEIHLHGFAHSVLLQPSNQITRKNNAVFNVCICESSKLNISSWFLYAWRLTFNVQEGKNWLMNYAVICTFFYNKTVVSIFHWAMFTEWRQIYFYCMIMLQPLSVLQTFVLEMVIPTAIFMLLIKDVYICMLCDEKWTTFK